MRGNPPVQIIGVLIAFLILGIPVWKLTGSEESSSAPAAVSSEAASTSVKINLTFSRPVRQFSLSYLGKTVMKSSSPGLEISREITLPEDGADLVLKVEWADKNASAAAVRIVASAPNGKKMDKTFWSKQDLETAVTLF